MGTPVRSCPLTPSLRGPAASGKWYGYGGTMIPYENNTRFGGGGGGGGKRRTARQPGHVCAQNRPPPGGAEAPGL